MGSNPTVSAKYAKTLLNSRVFHFLCHILCTEIYYYLLFFTFFCDIFYRVSTVFARFARKEKKVGEGEAVGEGKER